MAQVKGTAVDASLRYVRERFGEPALAAVLAALPEASCEYGVKGVYRIFFKLGSPEFIIGRAARVFSSYYDTGELRVVEGRAGRAVVELSKLEGSAPEFCDRIYGWMERTLELAGAKGLRSAHSRCVHRGDEVCRFEGSWD
jgi:hypothetical protein